MDFDMVFAKIKKRLTNPVWKRLGSDTKKTQSSALADILQDCVLWDKYTYKVWVDHVFEDYNFHEMLEEMTPMVDRIMSYREKMAKFNENSKRNILYLKLTRPIDVKQLLIDRDFRDKAYEHFLKKINERPLGYIHSSEQTFYMMRRAPRVAIDGMIHSSYVKRFFSGELEEVYLSNTCMITARPETIYCNDISETMMRYKELVLTLGLDVVHTMLCDLFMAIYGKCDGKVLVLEGSNKSKAHFCRFIADDLEGLVYTRKGANVENDFFHPLLKKNKYMPIIVLDTECLEECYNGLGQNGFVHDEIHDSSAYYIMQLEDTRIDHVYMSKFTTLTLPDHLHMARMQGHFLNVVLVYGMILAHNKHLVN